MASLRMQGNGSVREIAGYLRDGVLNSGLSCELVDSVERMVGDAWVSVMVFEKYYWRASNRASLTVVVVGDGQRVSVDAIGSGGGQGPLFKFSWGAEASFAGVVGDLLRSRGFA